MIGLLRAALVIARRDFTAVVFSRAFIFFLLGPMLPILLGLAFGGMGSRIASTDMRPVIGVALPVDQAERLERAWLALTRRPDAAPLPKLLRIPALSQPRAVLARPDAGVTVVLSGSLDRPELTGKADDINRVGSDVALLAALARTGDAFRLTPVTRHEIAASASGEGQGREVVGRAAQLIIFLLTMLLAGMVLSNLVEEKTNKIIEILAAAVPVDAIFLGKLLAMLAMSFVGILFWTSGGFALLLLVAGPGAHLPAPAVGWPAFLILAILYFAMAYTLLGSLFLGIGGQASTVREVQTLSMPVTMGQMLVFFFATFAAEHPGGWAEMGARLFPFSSPFAMIASAAESPALWPHLLALGWQALWVALLIRAGVLMFRRHVLKSGGPRRRLFSRAKG